MKKNGGSDENIVLYLRKNIDFAEFSNVPLFQRSMEARNGRSKGNKVDWLGNMGSDLRQTPRQGRKRGRIRRVKWILILEGSGITPVSRATMTEARVADTEVNQDKPDGSEI